MAWTLLALSAGMTEAEEPQAIVAELDRLAPKVTPMTLIFEAAKPSLVIRVTGGWRVGEKETDLAETRVDLALINPDGIELMKSPFVLPSTGPVIDRFLKIACQRQKRCTEFGPVDRATGQFIGRPDRYDSVVIDVMADARFEDLDAFVKAFQRLMLPHVQ